MADVMELSGKHRRRMKRLADAYVAWREERERMRRAINGLYWCYLYSEKPRAIPS